MGTIKAIQKPPLGKTQICQGLRPVKTPKIKVLVNYLISKLRLHLYLENNLPQIIGCLEISMIDQLV